MQDLTELLRNNPYPGRGIVVGKDCVYYWIMGRSANSRNRVFVPTEDGIRTEAHDPALLEDPSLIIYHPVRTMGDALVVTNGDQTDTIVSAGDFRRGCMAREFEPDEPNFTPRISAVVNADGRAIDMRVFERGVGETLACGTGACATLVAACLTGRAGRSARLNLLGGQLSIDWTESGDVHKTGPASTTYEGRWPAMSPATA